MGWWMTASKKANVRADVPEEVETVTWSDNIYSRIWMCLAERRTEPPESELGLETGQM